MEGTLGKVEVLRLNTDGSPITSKTHTHSSHSQTSRLLIQKFFLWSKVLGYTTYYVIRLKTKDDLQQDDRTSSSCKPLLHITSHFSSDFQTHIH